VKRLWLLYLVLIFGLSSIPSDPRPKSAPIFSDKIAHFVLYAGLTWWFVKAESKGKRRVAHIFLAALLLAGLTGLADEFYQGFVPNRTRELGDWIADLLGGFAGAMMALGTPPLSRLVRRGGKEKGERAA